MTDKKIIIGALSGWQFPHRRERVRKTFLPDVRRYGHEYLFLMGSGAEIRDPVVEHDILVLPVPNHYDALPMRTRAFCRWALENREFDWLLKCDDDSFLCVPRLHQFVQSASGDYLGLEYHPAPFWHSGGAGYLISRKAAQILADKMIDRSGPEDLLAGLYLNQHNIPTTYMQQTKNQVFGNGVRRFPTKENDLIVAHAAHVESWLTDELWRQCYEETR
jgi:hypothetical protein